jgi:formiminotetrahydrofolate cyclodeaminase
MTEPRTLADFLEALGSSAPTPGGGAATALVGALAAALAEMVANLTVGKPRHTSVEASMRSIIMQTQAAREDLLALVAQDEAAYAGVAAAYRQPKATNEEKARREEAIQTALLMAMRPPLRMMERVCDVLTLASEVAASGNPTVVSDAGCAALFGEAAVRAAALNVLANVVLLRDDAAANEARATVTRLEEQAQALRERTMAAVHARMGA